MTIIDFRGGVYSPPVRPRDLWDIREFGSFDPANTAAVNTATGLAAVQGVHDLGGGGLLVPRALGGGSYQMTRSDATDQKKGCFHLFPGVSLYGDNAKITLAGNCNFVTAKTTLGASCIITANTTETTTALTVDTSAGFAVGDDVFVRIGQATYDAVEPDHWLYAQVTAVPDGTHLTLDRPCGYALTVASVPTTSNRSVTKVTEWYQDAYIGGFDFYNPSTGSANAEGGLALVNARNVVVGPLAGYDCGSSLFGAQFTEGVLLHMLTVRRAAAQLAQLSKGKGVYLAECRNITFVNAHMKDVERDCFNIEGRCENITVQNLLFDNGFPGRDINNVAVFKLLYYGKLRVENLMIIGNPTYIADYAAAAGSEFKVGNYNDRATGSVLSGLYCDNVRDSLTIGEATYERIRTWTKRIPLTSSMSSAVTAGPSGLWRTVKVKASTVTGLTSFKLKGAALGVELVSNLVAGSSAYMPNVSAMTLAPNTSLAKEIQVSTGTVAANQYLLVEVEYWEDPTAPTQTSYDSTGLLG